jgi:crotonobetainyl-CoA:carnitine CoA-transferase CaiB-like acyl-CoA transferase
MRLVDELGQEHIGLPIKFTNEPGRADFRVPAPGSHTAEILRGVGYGDADLDRLRNEGAF